MEYSEKFVAFVDILGFTQLVQASESGEGLPLSDLLAAAKSLGTGNERSGFSSSGFTICPLSACIEKNLDFRVTQISDCVIVSSEVSPAGIINLVGHCRGAATRLLQLGLMCRGYITRGKVFHSDSQIIGTGYQKAYAAESGVTAFRLDADERGTPFIEIDPSVADYVSTQTDECVQKMFARMVKTSGEDVAIFPFQSLTHKFVVGGYAVHFDAEKELTSNNNLRGFLTSVRSKVSDYIDNNNASAVRKGRHYLNAIDAQLRICDDTDRILHRLGRSFPRPRGDA